MPCGSVAGQRSFCVGVRPAQLDKGGAAHLAARLGWSGLPTHRNVHHTTDRAAVGQLGRRLSTRPPALAERYVRQLHELNRCDLRLYGEAQQRFTAEAKTASTARWSAAERTCAATPSRSPQCPDEVSN